MSPDLSFANAGDAINIAAATTAVPIILTMVPDQTGHAERSFNLDGRDAALRRPRTSQRDVTTKMPSSAPDTALGRILDRILVKITLQLRVEFWMTTAQR